MFNGEVLSGLDSSHKLMGLDGTAFNLHFTLSLIKNNGTFSLHEPRHEISKMWYVRPANAQTNLRIRAV